MKRRIAGILAIAGLLAFPSWAESPEQAQFDFANGLFQRGFHKEAMEEYKVYLEKYPQGEYVPLAQYRMGEAAYAAHDYSSALEAFDKVLAGNADPDTKKRAKLSRGEVLYCLKRPADALVAIEPIAAEESTPELRARALYHLGRINA
ncbi:MAG TPA: tetratricopeptide repeat protein, partial [Candidatus Hydrogenedentes bacterium]|nr:tetratricopeptide repeat protein [Candidatus Hydrogenedentota bacterium]